MTKEKQYSVNVFDLTKDDILSTFMIAPVIKSKIIVDVEKGRIDGKAVVLDCPEERATAIIEIIRKKYGKNGMFRNRDYIHSPISGSNADCTFDADEIAYFEEILQKYPGVW